MRIACRLGQEIPPGQPIAQNPQLSGCSTGETLAMVCKLYKFDFRKSAELRPDCGRARSGGVPPPRSEVVTKLRLVTHRSSASRIVSGREAELPRRAFPSG